MVKSDSVLEKAEIASTMQRAQNQDEMDHLIRVLMEKLKKGMIKVEIQDET